METATVSVAESHDSSRLRYGRKRILEIKEHSSKYSEELYEGLIDQSALSQLNGRTKSKQLNPKGTTERERQQKTIVLGPQKRTWNTGCHVSHNYGKESGDGFNRSGKLNADSRIQDKQYPRPPTEYRRGGNRSNKRVDGNAAARYHRDDRHRENRRSSACEEEPEWFSGGPTTVNDTIELGRLLDDPEEDQPEETVESDRSKVSSTKHDVIFRSSGDQTKRDVMKKVDVEIVPDSLGSTGSETQGSRFKHFFSLTENDKSKTDNINDQLMKLLKGSTNTDATNFDKGNIENKLRSILLGHTLDSVDKSRSYATSANSRILTVEEIESQLNSCAPSITENRSMSVIESQRGTTQNIFESLKKESRGDNLRNSQISSESNLAPIIQSLALKQQSSTSKMTQPSNTSANMGMCQIPMHAPISTNAYSASNQINQLQQPDFSVPPGMPGAQQGVLRQLWDPNSVDLCVSAPPSSQQLSMLVSQRLAGVSPGLYSEFNHKLAAGVSPNMPHQNSLMPPRRPIVKVQQTVATSPNTQNFSLLNMPNPNISQRFGLHTHDGGQGLLNTGLIPHTQSKATLPVFPFPTVSNENRCIGVESQSFFDSFVSAPSSNINMNNPFYTQRTVNCTPKSENTLAFLSRLVDIDRSGVTLNSLKSHPSPYAPNEVRAKTLEEIEHQEMSSTGLFY